MADMRAGSLAPFLWQVGQNHHAWAERPNQSSKRQRAVQIQGWIYLININLLDVINRAHSFQHPESAVDFVVIGGGV